MMADPMKLAVLGHPVEHSLSPKLHAMFAEQAGISVEYGAIGVDAEGFVERVDALRADGYRGVNITVPHKAAAHDYADTLTDAALLAGAVNTLVFDDTVLGDNTDGAGFVADLQACGIDVTDKHVVVLGAGGATRGLLGPLAALKPAEIVVTGRMPYNAEALQQQFGPGTATDAPVQACTYLALKGIHADVLIHASPAGHSSGMPRLPHDLLADGAACYDLNYGAAHTVFADWASAHGAGAVFDGLGMLVEQGAAAFTQWTGKPVDARAALDQLRTKA